MSFLCRKPCINAARHPPPHEFDRYGGRMAAHSMRRWHRAATLKSVAALVGAAMAMPAQSADPSAAHEQLRTATPITRVIVVIGDNRSFDHLFGTYVLR
jgi:phospholipase C